MLACALAAPACDSARAAPSAPAASQRTVVAPSTLPRLRRAWSVAGLTTKHWRYKETAPASDGALFAVNASGVRHLVALDIATGTERWRVPQSLNPEPQIEFATESPNAVGLLLHLPTETEADDQACSRARPRKQGDDDGPRGVRTPFPVASVQSLEVTGDKARGRFVWSERGDRHGNDLGLARVQGKWRVVDDRPVGNQR